MPPRDTIGNAGGLRQFTSKRSTNAYNQYYSIRCSSACAWRDVLEDTLIDPNLTRLDSTGTATFTQAGIPGKE